jgi:hypothetical protein
VAVLFDTLKLAERLEAAGMPPEQAKGTAAALAEGLTGAVATTADVEASELRLRTEIARLRAEVRGWLITQAFAIVGAVAAIIGIAAALLRLLH